MADGGDNINGQCTDDERSNTKLLTRLKGTSKVKLQQNYRFLLNNRLNWQRLNEELLEHNIFQIEQSNLVINEENEERKRHILLSEVISLTENECYQFFHILYEIGGKQEIKHILESSEKLIPQSILSDFPEDIGTIIRTNRESIVSNIEINPTRDYLLELNLITQEEHRDILQLRTRQQQRTCLLRTLLAKDDRRWLKGFLYILKETNQTHLIDCGNQEAHSEEANGVSDLIDLAFGRTCIVDDSDDDFIIGIEGHSLDNNSINRNLMEEFERQGVLDVYPGNSIYIYIPQSYRRMNMADADIRIKNMKKILKPVLKWDSFSETKSLVVTFQRKLHGSFLTDRHGKIRDTDCTYEDNCSRCIRETVRRNLELILDEIETDIIEETLNLSNASEFIKESVVHINRPRLSRAKRFVMYMMQNESVLKNFITVFKKKSFVDLIPAECESCSKKDRDIELKSSYYQQDFEKLRYQVLINTSGITITQLYDLSSNGTHAICQPQKPLSTEQLYTRSSAVTTRKRYLEEKVNNGRTDAKAEEGKARKKKKHLVSAPTFEKDS